jgi:cell division protein FtsN
MTAIRRSMSEEHKAARIRALGQSTHPMLVGVFIGVLLGICLALGVALYLNRAPKPFVARDADTASKAETQAAKSAPKFEPVKPDKPAQPAAAAPQAGKPTEGKTRFDFYKILPGEEPVTGKELSQSSPSGAASRVVYYLQAGAFQRSADADNLKARLALAGLEAQIQTATLPDNSVWHRVRLGPYSKPQDLDKAKAALKDTHIDAAVIKVDDPLAKH